ncbi:MAG: hypothetical protein SWY16_05335 [Cyanobacteriota bacterium]|nr:hypothetical protein [Cyanobacteriota bacterium]
MNCLDRSQNQHFDADRTPARDSRSFGTQPPSSQEYDLIQLCSDLEHMDTLSAHNGSIDTDFDQND